MVVVSGLCKSVSFFFAAAAALLFFCGFVLLEASPMLPWTRGPMLPPLLRALLQTDALELGKKRIGPVSRAAAFNAQATNLT